MGSYEEKAAKYRKLAKMLDERLRQIEIRAGNDVNIGIMDYAYRRAMYDLRQLQGKRETYRFNRKIPTSEKELDRWIRAAEKFEHSKTSTIRGYKKVEKEKVATLNEEYDMDLTTADLKRIFDTGIYEQFKNHGTGTAWIVLGKLYRRTDTLQKAAEEARKKHIDIRNTAAYREATGDMDKVEKKVVNAEINNFIKAMGI